MKYTKSVLTKEVAENNEVPAYIVKKIINDFFKTMSIKISEGNEVTISGLGRFIEDKKHEMFSISFQPSRNLDKIYKK